MSKLANPEVGHVPRQRYNIVHYFSKKEPRNSILEQHNKLLHSLQPYLHISYLKGVMSHSSPQPATTPHLPLPIQCPGLPSSMPSCMLSKQCNHSRGFKYACIHLKCQHCRDKASSCTCPASWGVHASYNQTSMVPSSLVSSSH